MRALPSLALAAAFLLPGPAWALEGADNHVALARRLFGRGRAHDAKLELEAALRLKPDHADALALLEGGAAPALKGRRSEATASPAAGDARPLVSGLLERARAAFRESDLVGAEAQWRGVLRLDPGNAEAKEGLTRLEREAWKPDPDQPFDRAVGDLYAAALREARKGRLVEARAKLGEARALNPLHPRLKGALAEIEESARRQQAGREAEALAAEGAAALAQGDLAPAGAAFQRALALDPGRKDALEGLEAVFARGRAQAATALAQGAESRRKGDWEAAARAYSEAAALDPWSAEAKAGAEEALSALDQARSQAARRKDADRSYNAGVEAWNAGDLASAEAAFRACLELAPGDAEAAKALAALGQRKERRAGEARAEAARLLEEGRLLEKRGSPEQALLKYEQALAREPGLPAAAEARGRLKAALQAP